MDVIIQNVRCFSNHHVVRLSPLTLVTGENSSGKSTFLAIISALSGGYQFPMKPAFNDPPFSLGNYENIATYKGGKYGRADHFKIGFKDDDNRHGHIEVIATYSNDRGTPFLTNLTIKTSASSCELKLSDARVVIKGTFREVSSETPTVLDMEFPISSVPDLPTRSWLGAIFRSQPDKKFSVQQTRAYEQLYMLVDRAIGFHHQTEAMAPLRMKPLRTYDQSKLNYSADGDHVPYTLSRLFDEAKTDPVAAAKIKAMIRFGRDSGLYKDMKVKFLGKNVSDPFQILVSVSGRPANLVDVGYGVSQSLPIVAQSLLAPKTALLLLQQPEVHLHPKAQAAIGTFFADLVASEGKNFVIETHSDYLVDRVRQAVAKKVLKPSDVSLLYLEPHTHTTVIHQISIDENGNLMGSPLGYREFFMREEMSMLQLAKG